MLNIIDYPCSSSFQRNDEKVVTSKFFDQSLVVPLNNKNADNEIELGTKESDNEQLEPAVQNAMQQESKFVDDANVSSPKVWQIQENIPK